MSFGLSAAAIGGIAAGVGAIGGAVISSNGAKSAASTQANAANAGIAQQQQEFDTIQGLLKPYVDAGTSATSQYESTLGQLNNLTGANGGAAQQTAINGLKSNPMYTTAMDLGQQSILQSASATGGLRGGNTVASLGYLPQQILTNVMGSQIGNLQSSLQSTGQLIGIGENAAAGTGNAGISTGNNITSLIGQQGAINAGGILAGTNAASGAINGIGTYLGSNGGQAAIAALMNAGGAGGFNPAYQSAYSGIDNPANYG